MPCARRPLSPSQCSPTPLQQPTPCQPTSCQCAPAPQRQLLRLLRLHRRRRRALLRRDQRRLLIPPTLSCQLQQLGQCQPTPIPPFQCAGAFDLADTLPVRANASGAAVAAVDTADPDPAFPVASVAAVNPDPATPVAPVDPVDPAVPALFDAACGLLSVALIRVRAVISLDEIPQATACPSVHTAPCIGFLSPQSQLVTQTLHQRAYAFSTPPNFARSVTVVVPVTRFGRRPYGTSGFLISFHSSCVYPRRNLSIRASGFFSINVSMIFLLSDAFRFLSLLASLKHRKDKSLPPLSPREMRVLTSML